MFKKLFSNKGGIPIALLWTVVFFIVILLCTFVLEQYYMNVKAEIAKDALTFSALSVYKNIPISQLGGNIVVTQEMKNTVKAYLSKNLNLNSDLTPRQSSIVKNRLEIKDFKIYNRSDNDTKYPDGVIIQYKPSLYVSIKYEVEPILKGILGKTKTVYTSTVVELN